MQMCYSVPDSGMGHPLWREQRNGRGRHCMPMVVIGTTRMGKIEVRGDEGQVVDRLMIIVDMHRLYFLLFCCFVSNIVLIV